VSAEGSARLEITMSAFARQRERQKNASVKALVASMGLREEDDPENFQTAFEFCIGNLDDRNHKFPDTNKREVQRTVAAITERLHIYNQDAKAQTLKRLFANYESSLPPPAELEVPDAPYRIVSLLCH
jgi:hypothetical protein